jgi:FixJ family two-component response regulator
VRERPSATKTWQETMSDRKLILVLDDDPSVRNALERMLSIHGFTVQMFQSIEDFLTRANLPEAACAVLDVHVNDASGIDLSYQLKRSGHSLPVIFITGSDSEQTRAAALKAGCAAYLTKPFGSGALVKAIKSSIC